MKFEAVRQGDNFVNPEQRCGTHKIIPHYSKILGFKIFESKVRTEQNLIWLKSYPHNINYLVTFKKIKWSIKYN